MTVVLIIVAVLLVGFIAYTVLKSKPKPGAVVYNQSPAPKASKPGPSAPPDDEDEVTRVRIAGPRLIRTMGGLRVGDELPINGFVTIGRGQSSTLKFADGEMSSTHAEFRADKGKTVVIDLASTNGTFVNGNRIDANAAVELQDGDQVKLGMTIFLFKNQQ